MRPGTALLALAALAAFLTHPAASEKPHKSMKTLQLVEATIPELRQAMDAKRLTAERLVRLYLARIEAYDKKGPAVNAFLYVSPKAEEEARRLDAARRQGKARGPLYGIPVLLKDNIDVAGMPTTAGSVALAGSMPAGDAFITRKLREAGAIILGKGTLTRARQLLRGQHADRLQLARRLRIQSL